MDQDSISIIAEKKEKKIKIILIGDQCVGKSKLMEMLLNIESKVNDKQIQSVDFFLSRIQLPDKLYQKIYVWITSGEIKNISMIRAFLMQCHIYIIAFSLNNPVSMENALNTWFSCCLKNGKHANSFFLFLGTMSDKERLCGSSEEIIQMISQKCNESKAFQTKSNSYEIRGIRPSERWDTDVITEQTKMLLPANVYYSETSAQQGDGMERSMSILSKLVSETLAIMEKSEATESPSKSQSLTPLGTPLEIKRRQSEEYAQYEVKKQQQEQSCCNLF